MRQKGNETTIMRHSLYKFTTMRHYDVCHFVHVPKWHAPLNHLTVMLSVIMLNVVAPYCRTD